MAAKKGAKKSANGVNKTQFILSLPTEMSATEVVTKGKEQGIDFEPKYVWRVRAEARQKAGTSPRASATAPATAPAKRGPGRPPKNRAVATNAVATNAIAANTSPSAAVATSGEEAALERALKKLVLDVGRTRAEEVFRRVQEQVNAFERG